MSLGGIFGKPPKDTYSTAMPDYGLREDGTRKGRGYFGEIDMGNGDYMTEKSVGVNINDQEMLIPTIVPTLTREEVDFMVSGGDPRENDTIMNKAVEHARKRLANNQSPFYD